MKFLFLFFIVGAIAFTPGQKETLKKHSKECTDEVKIDSAKVEAFRQGDWTNEDEDSQKFWLCMFKKSQVMTDEGHFKTDAAMATVAKDEPHRDDMEKSMKECENEHGETPHESAYKFMKCYHEKRPNHDMF